MTKKELVKAVHEIHGGVSYKEAEDIVETVLNLVKDRLIRGENVLLTGFGLFKVVRRKARRVKNPRTGDLIDVKPWTSLVFRPSKRFRLNDDERT